MKIESIKDKLNKIIEDYEFTIYSVKTKKEFGEKILEILLKGKNITTDVLEQIHTKLFENLEDDLDDDYFLELSSVGAEYPLNSLDEIIEHVDGYVYVETKDFKGVGLLLEVNNNELVVKYNQKGQFRKIKIEYDDVLNIRTSVKI
mgnify:CR=1 FL=1